MKTKTLSLSTILAFLGLIIVIHSMSSFAYAGEEIVCSTAFGEKTFSISGQKLAFHKEDEQGVSRAISSLNALSVRTQTKQSGFVKSLYINGNQYRINIKDAGSFSDVHDYLSITSPKGHVMTYPLTCHSA